MVVRTRKNSLSDQFIQVPLQLQSVVIPQFIKTIGGAKYGFVTYDMVLDFLGKNKIMFDLEILAGMFKEADFQQYGYLNESTLYATISGRYPKRKYTLHWQDLLNLVLREPKEILDSAMKIGGDALQGYKETRGPNQGTFNSDTLWDRQPPPIPTNKQVTQNMQISAKLSREQRALYESQISREFSSLKYGLSDEIPLRTTQGVKSLQQIDDEFTINQMLYNTVTEVLGERPRTTFCCAKQFQDFNRGLRLNHSLASDISHDKSTVIRPKTCPASFCGGNKKTFSSTDWWEFAQADTIKSIQPSPLQKLRKSVKNKVPRKPVFNLYHKRLLPCDTMQKCVLGQQLEMNGASSTMSRVYPVRGVVTNQDGYVKWGDFASRCPTNPERWDSCHPSIILQS
eukprot:TRINITY_DN14841_c0_g1_i1.p1 TRINITY_DN14841_c0_g1~~TRINITY_DN14841_c0_g1_i1.p1  ORF type:complete len:398 (-),score=9.76 TRINITY_DN14841_c0_g1_i1:819-2012(-)